MTDIVRGRLVIDDALVPGQLEISEGRIAAIEPDPSAADGPYVAPGFVDVHVHGWGGHDAMGSREDLDGMARALLRHGVTSFLPTAVTASIDTLTQFADRVREWMASPPADGADPLGFDLEGPFLSVRRKGAHTESLLRAPADVPPGAIDPLVSGLRVITMAPERPGALALIRRLADAGVAVSLGHSDATLDEARAGYAAGAVTTTHLFNAMSGVDHHRPGLAVAALTDDAVYTELIADGFHVHRSLWPIILRTKPADRLLLVSDALAAAGTDATTATVGGLAVEIRGGRVVLAGTETLAGSVIALDTAVRNLAREGVPLPAAVAAASRNPLAMLRVEDRGRIAVGLRADLVELDEEFAVRRVWRQGVRFEAG